MLQGRRRVLVLLAVLGVAFVAPGVPSAQDAAAEKVAYRADSILARLPDADFRAGVTALRAHAKQAAPNEPVIENIDLFVLRRSGV